MNENGNLPLTRSMRKRHSKTIQKNIFQRKSTVAKQLPFPYSAGRSSGCRISSSVFYRRNMDLHDAGVSFGKYRAYLILHDLDPSISLDDIRSMTMREIYDLIDSYDGNQGTENADTKTDEAETETGTKAGTSDTYCKPDRRTGGGHGQGRQHHGEHEEGETN